MSALVLAGGAALGVLCRIEEVTPGLSLGLSSDSAWVAAAFAAGTRATSAGRAALLAATAMCCANGGYYAWILLTERGTSLAAAAGDPWRWVAAGVLTGLVFGAAGRLWRNAAPLGRLLTVVPLAMVLVVEGGDALRGGPATEGIGFVVGLALPVASAPSPRWAACVSAAALAALAYSGFGSGLLP